MCTVRLQGLTLLASLLMFKCLAFYNKRVHSTECFQYVCPSVAAALAGLTAARSIPTTYHGALSSLLPPLLPPIPPFLSPSQ